MYSKREFHEILIAENFLSLSFPLFCQHEKSDDFVLQWTLIDFSNFAQHTPQFQSPLVKFKRWSQT